MGFSHEIFSTQVGGRTPGFSGGEGWFGDSTVLQDFLLL